jgi:dienelactone hydrolase
MPNPAARHCRPIRWPRCEAVAARSRLRTGPTSWRTKHCLPAARLTPASSSSPTCVACTPTTRTLLSASPALAGLRSPSTISGAPRGVGARGEDFDWQAHRGHVTPAQVALDTAAAVAHLRDQFRVGSVFTAGFCFGGSQSWRLAASNLPLNGVIGFYGQPKLVSDVIPEMRRPLLLLVAGADRATPMAEFHSLRDRLAAAGVDFEMQVYDGAPHSFFDRSFDEWQEACADAWLRVLSFIERHRA